MTDYPLFAHQLTALRRRRQIEDDLAVNGTLIRAGYRRRARDEDQIKPRSVGRRTGVDMWAPSPLVTFKRDVSGVRSPHLSVTPVSKTVVPRSVAGECHPDYPDQSSSVEDHYGYIERHDGKDGTALGHGKYIERDDAREVDETSGRASYVYSNISKNPDKRRAFGRAVWEHEMTPRTHHLESWVSHLPWWEALAEKADSPAWIEDAANALRKEAKSKTKSGKKPADRLVRICKVTQQEACDRIVWCEAQPEWEPGRKQVAFKCGPGGRVQYRIVYELPHELSAKERMENVQLMCRHLKQRSFMYVAAVHQPDAHNDPRNFHVHIDMYDRPCRFLKRFDKWDFEVTKRDKKGHIRRPFERNKIADFARDPDKGDHRAWGKKVITKLRESFVEFTNEVLERGGHQMRYDARDFATRGIALTPTRKLGGKASAAEKDGLRTRNGDHNAVSIWGDVFSGIDRCRDEQLEEARQSFNKIEEAIVRIPAGLDHVAVTKSLLEHRGSVSALIERTHALEVGDAEVRMAMSRAETILREAKERAANHTRSKGFKSGQLAALRADVQADAAEHLSFIRILAPSHADIGEERVGIVEARRSLEGQHQALMMLATAMSKPDQIPATKTPSARSQQVPRIAWTTDDRTVVFDLRALASTRAPAPAGKFVELEIGRLLAWLNKHRDDAEAMAFGGETVTFRPPTAVATLLIKYQSASAVRTWIGGEQVRRARATDGPSAGKAGEIAIPSSAQGQAVRHSPVDASAERSAQEASPSRAEGQRLLGELRKGPTAESTKDLPDALAEFGIDRSMPDPSKLASIDAAVRALRAAEYPPQVRSSNGFFSLAPDHPAALEGAHRWEAEQPIQDTHALKWVVFLDVLKKTLERTKSVSPIGFMRGDPVVQQGVLGRELSAAYARVRKDEQVISLLRQVDDDIKKRENENKKLAEKEQHELEVGRVARLGRIQDALAGEERRILAATAPEARRHRQVSMEVLKNSAAKELIARENGGPEPQLVFAGMHLEMIAAEIQDLPGGKQYLAMLRSALGTRLGGPISGTLPFTSARDENSAQAGVEAVVPQRSGGQGR